CAPGSKRFGLVELALSAEWRVAKNEKGRSRAGAHYTRGRARHEENDEIRRVGPRFAVFFDRRTGAFHADPVLREHRPALHTDAPGDRVPHRRAGAHRRGRDLGAGLAVVGGDRPVCAHRVRNAGQRLYVDEPAALPRHQPGISGLAAGCAGGAAGDHLGVDTAGAGSGCGSRSVLTLVTDSMKLTLWSRTGVRSRDGMEKPATVSACPLSG